MKIEKQKSTRNLQTLLLAAAIREVLQRADLAADKTRSALAYVIGEHSEEKMIERTLEAYRRFLNFNENIAHQKTV